ncbi:MAG: hypothetical protein ACI9J2_001384 [Saprospiraceae bacterium]|jgi:hypothetical protein
MDIQWEESKKPLARQGVLVAQSIQTVWGPVEGDDQARQILNTLSAYCNIPNPQIEIANTLKTSELRFQA